MIVESNTFVSREIIIKEDNDYYINGFRIKVDTDYENPTLSIESYEGGTVDLPIEVVDFVVNALVEAKKEAVDYYRKQPKKRD